LNKVSVIIITGNEENNITDCLKSVQWADEIIVVDSESTDKTVEISKKFTEKVFVKKWLGFAKQKKYALSLASNNWVLSIDADERITEELAEEILNCDLSCNGYFIGRKNHFLRREINSCKWNDDFPMRFFNRKKTIMYDRLVHEGFIAEKPNGTLKNKMNHFTYDSIESALSKINNYSTLQAEEMLEKKNSSGLHVLLHPISAFLKFFISYKGYKDGKYGLIISFFNSITALLTYTKIWEIKIKRNS